MPAAGPSPVIALDGPAAVGKGTVARAVARRLDFNYLDTGRIYRITALLARQAGGPAALDSPQQVIEAAQPLLHDFAKLSKMLEDSALYTEETAEGASLIAQSQEIRDALLAAQRSFRRPPGLVADGRDMAAKVFPDAVLKIYLDADLEVRRERFRSRAAAQGMESSKIAACLAQFEERSRRDERRSVAPVRPDDEATIIATDALGPDEVADRIIDLYRAS